MRGPLGKHFRPGVHDNEGLFLPKERADTLYRGEYAKAPNVTFVNVADSGHFIMLDQPEAFSAALTAFLRGS